jgi:gamma-glutamylcyclotransferase (GGCT)/AIG2-like uncharacterized protein YtfP
LIADCSRHCEERSDEAIQSFLVVLDCFASLARARMDVYELHPMTPDRLFVYGTLMRGFDHPMAQLLSRSAGFVGEARCRGQLYLVKQYPGMVLSDTPADVVSGELYLLKQPEALLREFDMYEACGEGFAEPTEYVRRLLPVELVDGAAGEPSTSEAWTYLYNWPIAGLPRIASGRFVEK